MDRINAIRDSIINAPNLSLAPAFHPDLVDTIQTRAETLFVYPLFTQKGTVFHIYRGQNALVGNVLIKGISDRECGA